MQSVELVLDAALDAAVRAEWAALSAAGLPSQADHTGATNAPHVTLVSVDSLDDVAEAALARLSESVPLAVRLGPPVDPQPRGARHGAGLQIGLERLKALHCDLPVSLETLERLRVGRTLQDVCEPLLEESRDLLLARFRDDLHEAAQ